MDPDAMRRALIAIALINTLSACAAERVTRVTVRDQQFKEVRTLADEPALKSFADQWDQKREVKPFAAPDWAYKLDIIRKSTGAERWLYDASGWTALLAVKDGPVYRIAEPTTLNAVLGVPDSAAPGVGGGVAE